MHRKKIGMEHPLSWTWYSQQPVKSYDISIDFDSERDLGVVFRRLLKLFCSTPCFSCSTLGLVSNLSRLSLYF